MAININITFTFMHISRLILASKSTSFTFSIWIFAYIITFFRGRFVCIHTFFYRQIMRDCRLRTCIYDIRQTSYERRFHHGYVMPSVPIWATPVLSRATPPRLYIGIYYWGENSFDLIHTHTWENPARFFRAEPLYVLYIAGKNVKNCNVWSCLCALDPSIFHFIWVKYGGKIW